MNLINFIKISLKYKTMIKNKWSCFALLIISLLPLTFSILGIITLAQNQKCSAEILSISSINYYHWIIFLIIVFFLFFFFFQMLLLNIFFGTYDKFHEKTSPYLVFFLCSVYGAVTIMTLYFVGDSQLNQIGETCSFLTSHYIFRIDIYMKIVADVLLILPFGLTTVILGIFIIIGLFYLISDKILNKH